MFGLHDVGRGLRDLVWGPTPAEAKQEEPTAPVETDGVDWDQVLNDAYDEIQGKDPRATSSPEPITDFSLPEELQAMLEGALQEMAAQNAAVPQAPQEVGGKWLEALVNSPLFKAQMAQGMHSMFCEQVRSYKTDPEMARAGFLSGVLEIAVLANGQHVDGPVAAALQGLGFGGGGLLDMQAMLQEVCVTSVQALQQLEIPSEEQEAIVKNPHFTPFLEMACVCACSQNEEVFRWMENRQVSSTEDMVCVLLLREPAKLFDILQKECPDSYEQFKADMRQSLQESAKWTEEDIKTTIAKAKGYDIKDLQLRMQMYQEDPVAFRRWLTHFHKQLSPQQLDELKTQYADLPLDENVRATLLQDKEWSVNIAMARAHAFCKVPEALAAVQNDAILADADFERFEAATATYLVDNFYNRTPEEREALNGTGDGT